MNFFLVSFFKELLAWSSKWKKNIHKNLNNCHNCFFMFCSYENSSFCFVVIKINVKVLGNYWVPYQQMFFFINVLVDLDCKLTCLISKACWPFTNEKDLTNMIWHSSNQIWYYTALNQHDFERTHFIEPIYNIPMICEHQT